MLKSCPKILAIVILFLAAMQTVQAQIAPSMVNLSNAPIKLVSITSTVGDFLSSVKLTNVSNKTVVSFQLGVIMSVPEGCGPTEAYSAAQLMQLDAVNVEPGAKIQTASYRFAPKVVNDFGKENNASVVHTQLAVVKVEFKDGTSWAGTHSGNIYDPGLMSKNAAVQCVKSRLN